jgi:cell pole-organizing protein PopZ
MKKKMIIMVALVVASAGLLVVQGVSQPSSPSEAAPPPTSFESPRPAFNRVEPRTDTQERLNFEQLAEALKGVRARQKELKAQETDILAKMADKVEEKRKDLQKAEEVLRQVQEHSQKSIVPPSEQKSLQPSRGATEWGSGNAKK